MELLSSPSSSQHQRLIIFLMTLFSSLMARLHTRVPVNKCLNFLNQWALNVLRGKGWQTSCKKWVWIKVFFFFLVSYMLIVLLSSKEISITSRISYLDSCITIHRWLHIKNRSSIGHRKTSPTILLQSRNLLRHSNLSMWDGNSEMNLQLGLTRLRAIQLLWQQKSMVLKRRSCWKLACQENSCLWRGIHLSTSSSSSK